MLKMKRRSDLGQIAIIISLALFVLAPKVTADDLPYGELKGEGKIEFLNTPEFGKPFTLRFSFTPRTTLLHTKGIPDTARINPMTGVKYVSGDAVVVDYFEEGQTVIITATYLVDTPISFNFEGEVTVVQATGLAVIGANQKADPGGWAKFFIQSEGFDWQVISPKKVISLRIDSTGQFIDSVEAPHLPPPPTWGPNPIKVDSMRETD